MATTKAENLVEFNIHGNARTITLNRPSKLNALNTEMCKEITPRLIEFSKSNSANLILIKSNNEKSFCSGGDVIQCAKNNLLNQSEKSIEFFKNEYNLNYLLSIYGKPIVSLINGISMGGGVGLSVHGAFRVVTDSTKFAMPETSIGFFNDVGTSFWLSKLDSNLGCYLSLTGDELTGFDTLLLGYGTHYVPSNRFNELIDKLSTLELADLSIDRRNNKIFNNNNKSQLFAIVNSIIEEFTIEIPKNHKFKYSNDELNTIEKCFNFEVNKTIDDINKSLNEDGSKFAIDTINKLNSKSPISLKLNLALLLRNKDATIQESLTRELKLAAKLMTNYRDNDFNDFINNKLIAKNSTSIISKYYPTIKDVPASIVDELVSLDVYNPKLQDSENKDELEKTIESLNTLKVGNFANLGESVSNFTNYPHHMGLPTQAEIKNYVKGSTNTNSQVLVSYKDTLDYFNIKYDGKAGVNAKVKLVLNRKTKPSSIDSEYIEWTD
jgi:3-hydroxyisobutyryl-CoA hydrolase